MSLHTLVACALALVATGATIQPRPQPRVERDVAYGAEPAQRLDLMLPSEGGFPTVIFVHGGSLTTGDKADADYGRVCDPFPAQGLACVSVNYRLLPDAPWPAQAADVSAAVAWVHRNIASRGGNPNELFLFGHSSGAMLAGLVSADARYLTAHGLTSRILRGVVPMGSIMWDVDLQESIKRNGRDRVAAAFPRDPRGKAFGTLDQYESTWPINFVRAGLPPFLFLIAESEQVNPPVLATNRQFVDDARARGNEADWRVLTGRTHYSAIRLIHQPGDDVFTEIVAFVRKHRAM